MPKFLEECSKDPDCNRKRERVSADLSDFHKVWNVLFSLRRDYDRSNNRDFKAHTYHAMAKLLLSRDDAPIKATNMERLSENQYRAQHISNLIDALGHLTKNLPKNSLRVRKWSHIYLALLFREWGLKYSQDHRNENLEKAYVEIRRAMELKTTRMVYLIAAQLIMDDNFTPEGMNREEALREARRFLGYALEQSSTRSHSTANIQDPWHWFIKTAKPPYLRDLMGRVERAKLQNFPRLLPVGEQADPLANTDFDNLVIATRPEFQDLPFRDNPMIYHPMNRAPLFPYDIENTPFVRQNVEGANMDCFFNAMGLGRNNAMVRLREYSHDPTVRYMIANEILSMARNPEQLSPNIRAAIDYDAWQQENSELDAAQQEYMVEGLVILARFQANDTALKRRAFSLRAFNAFVDHFAQNGVMAGLLVDVPENGNANYTSVDAIAYINRIGIKVFGAQGDLIHQFIPANAEESRYLYWTPSHFQALLPSAELPEEPVEEIRIHWPDEYAMGPKEIADYFASYRENIQIQSFPSVTFFCQGGLNPLPGRAVKFSTSSKSAPTGLKAGVCTAKEL